MRDLEAILTPFAWIVKMFYALTLLALLATPIHCEASALSKPTLDWDEIKFVHAFGDSYSFVQGTQGLANFSFIGDAQDFSFTPHQLLTNEIIPRNASLIISSQSADTYEEADYGFWLEFLTGCLQGKPSECRRQLWDFSFAGADIDGNLLPLHHPFTVPLVDQVKQWLEFAADIIPHPVGQTLTTWWIGINDTGDTVSNATITDFSAFWEVEMNSYFKAVQAATDRGLQTHLFINVPPEERSPNALGDATKAALLKTHIDEFNDILAGHIAAFEAANPHATVLTFDAHSWFNTVLDNPTSFGFTNTTG
ncbi:hypothetical protein CVT26_010315 [Gymnopilus dilepis]|uniref:Carbohydrate esterase family 16 protein n=1 Tax=Gymnopilus dilepis TaxID=231916 RepID=A0A409Y0Y7_9AGAR|nr:hypothetical protein CVT26_010315 [Gymnopilus dilepis]